jgi:hypothetical protein
VADWQEDAVSFIARAERHTGGSVDLPHRTDVERVGAADARRTAARAS